MRTRIYGSERQANVLKDSKNPRLEKTNPRQQSKRFYYLAFHYLVFII